MADSSDEEFWRVLIKLIEEGSVVPIIGPDIVTISPPGQKPPVRFVDRVAELLAIQHKHIETQDSATCPACGQHLPSESKPKSDIDYLLCCFGRQGKDRNPDNLCEDIVRLAVRVEDELKELEARLQQEEPEAAKSPSLEYLPQPLLLLAEIPRFDFYVTTTYDILLERILEAKVKNFAIFSNFAKGSDDPDWKKLKKIKEERVARRSELTSRRNKSAIPWGNNACLLYIFGRAAISSTTGTPEEFAFSEAQYLQQMYNRISSGDKELHDLLKNSDLLFIGVTFPDWLTRFLIKAVRGKEPLWKRNQGSHEFIVNSSPIPGGFESFIKLFMGEKRTYVLNERLTCSEFAAELHRRWFEAHTERRAAPLPPDPDTSSKRAPTVFISYNHEAKGRPEHRAAVKQFVEDLRELGGLKIIFDQEVDFPKEGVPDWSESNAKKCDKVIVIGSPTYYRAWNNELDTGKDGDTGIGAKIEIEVIKDEFSQQRGQLTRIVPVILKKEDYKDMPPVMKKHRRLISGADRIREISLLHRWLLDEIGETPDPV